MVGYENKPAKRAHRLVVMGIGSVALLLVTGFVTWLVLSRTVTTRSDNNSATGFRSDEHTVAAIDSANIIDDPDWFKQAYEEGYRLYVMHSTKWGECVPWDRTQPQLKMALQAGLMIAVYTRDPTCYQQGIEAAGPYRSKLQFFALDIETDPGVPVTREMVDGVKAMGVRPVIYTGSGMWPDLQGSTADQFSDVALWDAQATYDAPPASWRADMDNPRPVEYGGWNTVDNPRIGVQQYFEYTLNGVKVDLNSFRASFLEGK